MKTFPEVPTDPGVTRQVLSESPELMVVCFRYSKEGAEGAIHNHPHVQSTYVKEGKFRFTMNGESFEVGQGESFIVPSNAKHGCVCIEPGSLIDCFTPRRDDFL